MIVLSLSKNRREINATIDEPTSKELLSALQAAVDKEPDNSTHKFLLDLFNRYDDSLDSTLYATS